MIDWLHPSLVLIMGSFVLALTGERGRRVWMLALPVFALVLILGLQPGVYGQFQFLGLELTPMRVDPLSLVFAYVFGIILIIGAIYALHVGDRVQHIAAFAYGGSALGVVLAGDLVTLYVFWELMVITSVWLVWRRRTETSYAAGMRYLLVHAVGGVLLLAGIVAYYQTTGSIDFNQIETGGPAFWLILTAFMINAAVPPLHAWLTDAYPEATITGAIFLSALTTKTAVYTLIRGYPGTEILVWLGAIMALWGVVYAVLANDIRRLLAYHIVSQVGYMVAGVGMGTMLALNGASSHAFTHILYKSLLFMGAGAVIHMTGKSKLSELGGLYKYMPWTFVLYMIGAFSISAFPLFSGFVSKTMVVEAAAADYRPVIFLMLLCASAGTFLHTGLKLPWFTFMGKDSGLRPKEAPLNMLIAMSLAAFACIFIGVFPGALYAILPGPVEYNAYTTGHVLKELQLLLFTGLGFFLMLKHLGGEAKISADTDWLYRSGGKRLVIATRDLISNSYRGTRSRVSASLRRQADHIDRRHGRKGKLARSWPIGSMAMWTAILLAALLLFGIR